MSQSFIVNLFSQRLKIFFSKQADLILLTVITLLGAGLRLHHFNLSAIWSDEALSANILSNNFLNLWSKTFFTANNPTFTYVLKIWSEFFGTSVSSLRLMSIFFSLLSVILIYRLGKLLFGRLAGLWSSFLMSISYASIFFAIQARPYSLVILLGILSCYYFSSLILQKKTKLTFLLYSLFTLLGLYSHPWFFFLLASQIMALIIKKTPEIKKIFFCQLFLLVASAPLILKLMDSVISGSNNWIQKPTLNTILITFKYFTYGATGFYIFLFFSIPILLFLISQKITGLTYLTKFKLFFKEETPLFKGNFLLAFNFFATPLLLAFFISKFSPMYQAERHEAIILPGFILILSYLLSKISNRLIIYIIVIFLMISAGQVAVIERQQILSYKTDQKQAADFLVKNAGNNDLLIFTDLSNDTFDYYLPRLNKSKTLFNLEFPLNIPEKPAYQSTEWFNNYNRLEKKIYSIVISLKRIKDKVFSKSVSSGNFIFPESDYSFLINKIKKDKPENVWVVYDSKDLVTKELINRLNADLNLVNTYDFIKTTTYDRTSSNFPMFFDYILQYKVNLAK